MRAAGAAAPLLAALLAASAGAGPPVLASDGRYAMGTVLEVTLVVGDASAAREPLARLFGLAARLDDMLSRQRATSELNRLNAAAGSGPAPVALELWEVLVAAADGCRMTHGAFDVTVAPLVALWTEAARRDRPPAPYEVARARSFSGCNALRLPVPGTAELAHAGTSVDLGGIAKGFALDRMRRLLREDGIERALLSFGQSSVWALGAPPGAEGWRLLVRGVADEFAGIVSLRDQAFSISGSLGQWSEIGGVRYGHVIDQRSGMALARGRQAAVVAATATRAEVLSTALVVLGEREGLELLAGLPDAEGLLLDESGRTWMSEGWMCATRFGALKAEAPPPLKRPVPPRPRGLREAPSDRRPGGRTARRRWRRTSPRSASRCVR